MSTPPVVILSPHLDDAVLSCWHLLCGPGEVEVINVFAGTPEPGSGSSWWDRASGATDSAQRMQERRAEDAEAFAIAGRKAVHLDFLDEQYDPVDQSEETILSALRSMIAPDAVVYVPAALGEHGDHERVRSAGLRLAASGQPVRLYADHPHAVRRGWPAWIDGAESEAGRDVIKHWDSRLEDVGVDRTRPEIHHLDDAEQERKLLAVSAYRTQIPALAESVGQIDGFPTFPHEFVWTLA
jgi:LmbE family N-acetylglucosaminyl deacetylase